MQFDVDNIMPEVNTKHQAYIESAVLCICRCIQVERHLQKSYLRHLQYSSCHHVLAENYKNMKTISLLFFSFSECIIHRYVFRENYHFCFLLLTTNNFVKKYIFLFFCIYLHKMKDQNNRTDLQSIILQILQRKQVQNHF